MIQGLPARLFLAAFFLASVNLLSGYLAVELRYPSLWGNAEVFSEYAFPMVFNWALAHLFSMLPLAVLVTRLPLMSASQIRRCRWLIGGALVLLFLVEVKLPQGILRHNPFVLFLLVDAACVMLISLVFYPPYTGIVIAASVAAVAFYFLPYERSPRKSLTLPELNGETELTQAEDSSFFEEISYFENDPFWVVTVRGVVGPSIGPSQSQICQESRRLVDERGTLDSVKIMVHPWFEAEDKYVYPAGSASYVESDQSLRSWQCNFILPSAP